MDPVVKRSVLAGPRTDPWPNTNIQRNSSSGEKRTGPNSGSHNRNVWDLHSEEQTVPEDWEVLLWTRWTRVRASPGVCLSVLFQVSINVWILNRIMSQKSSADLKLNAESIIIYFSGSCWSFDSSSVHHHFIHHHFLKKLQTLCGVQKFAFPDEEKILVLGKTLID